MSIERVEVRHASEAVARRVRAWFAADAHVGARDGSRSVHLPHPEKRGWTIKIKGAGFSGGPIRFGRFVRSGPAAAVFDFDGRMMEDVASGHDNAFLGGASFQQAATEYRVTRIFAGLGIPAVPCVGYGRVETAEHASWFSICEWDRNWTSVELSASAPLDEYLAANLHTAKLILRLAIEHDLVGYCWLVRVPDGSYLAKDLHPFRRLDAVNMSQISWAMQVLFALYIRSEACLFFPRAAGIADVPDDIGAWPLRALVADAGAEDREEFASLVAAPYMIRPPVDFTPQNLLKALKSTRVGRAALNLCPQRYARW